MFAKVVSVLVILLFYELGMMAASGQDDGESIGAKAISLAIVPKEDVSARLGHPINISCFSENHRPLQSCRWERLDSTGGTRYFVHLTKAENDTGEGMSSESSDTFHCNCSYKYSGVGLDKGDCTLEIQNVEQFHDAKWCCLLLDEDRNNSYIGNLKLTVRNETVNKPYFKDPETFQDIVTSLANSTKRNITCCVDEEDPNVPMSLGIFLASSLDYINNIQPKDKDVGDRLYMRGNKACRVTRYTFHPDDNGKLIVCNATYMYHSEKHELFTTLSLSVKYAPILYLAEPTQDLIINDDRLVFTLPFHSNPRPHITWNLLTDVENDVSFEIQPSHLKYRPVIQHNTGDNYTAQLTILNFESEDYKRVFKLNISNDIGYQSLLVRVHGVSPPPGEENETYWLMIILGAGAVLTLAVIFCIVCIAIQKSRARRRRNSYEVGQIRHTKYTPKRVEGSVSRKNEEETEPVEIETSM